jgi:putative ABC transport system permease protein
MSLIHLLWRNIIHRRVLSLLTIFSVTATVALIVFLLLCNAGVEKGAEKGYGPFEVVIGAKGSGTQLALNTFYHIGTPTGNIPLDVFEQVKKEDQAEATFAMTTGDNLNGYPIVGIDPSYFVVRYGDRNLTSGKLYGQSGEAILGSFVAKSMDLKVGDEFKGGHGLIDQGAHVDNGQDHDEHDKFGYKVVGILPKLNTSDDRAVFTTMDYAWAVHQTQQGSHKDVTAILVKPKSLLGAQTMKLKYDKIDNVQAVYTSKAVADVVNAVDKGTQIISIVTILCVVLAAISILLSLVAAVNERKKDVGLLRLIGKSGHYVLLVMIGEGVALTGIGLMLGLVTGHLGSFLGSDALFDFSGVQIDPWAVVSGEWILVIAALGVGILASLGPALRLYRVDPLQLFR